MSENRQPQVGDFVDVGFAGKIYSTKITKIDGVVMYLVDLNSGANSAIYWRNDWYLANGVKADSIAFRKGAPVITIVNAAPDVPSTLSEGLTGNQLADLNLLVLADYPTFQNICLTNKKLHMLCTDPKYQNELYSERVKLHMPKFISLVDSKNLWRTVHDKVLEIKGSYISSEKLILELIGSNDLLGLKVLALETNPKSVINVIEIDDVYRDGSADMLKWILEEGHAIEPKYLSVALTAGKVDILDFINKMANSNTSSLGQPQSEKEPNISAYLEEIEKRTGLAEADDIIQAREAILDPVGLRNAASYGHIVILDWYLQNHPEIIPIADISKGVGMSMASQYVDASAGAQKHIAVLEWMKANKIPIYNLRANGAGIGAASGNSVLVLDWLEKEGLFNMEAKKELIQIIAETASHFVSLDAYKWAIARGAQALPLHLGIPLMRGDIPMLEFLNSKGVFPDMKAIKDIKSRHRFHNSTQVDRVVVWLKAKGLYMD